MEEILSFYNSYNELEKQWIIFRDKGTKSATALVNNHLKLIYFDLEDWGSNTLIKDNIILQNQIKNSIFKTNVKQFQLLYSCFCELEVITEKLNQSDSVIKAFRAKINNNNQLTMFLNYYLDIVKMYEKCLDNKKTIMNTLMTCEDREQLLAYLTAWQGDIHIDRNTIERIQDMISTYVSLQEL